jgi:SAM-dependent methyltransferase
MGERTRTEPVLPFTGERYTPESVREIAYEHWHRYAFALGLAKGRRVLDAACGEGYGSALLAQAANSVVGVDLSDAVIAHARSRYDAPNLRFEVADATALDAFDSAQFDLIVSFETIEHVQQQPRMLDGFARLLAPDGLLLVSTPDKRNTTDLSGQANPHHVRELYREEFEMLLRSHFPQVRLYAQKLLFQSALWALDADGGATQLQVRDGARIRDGLHYPPMYYLAVCARSVEALSELPALSLHGDAQESVYADYNDEVRRNIAARTHIAALEAEVLALRKAIAAQSASAQDAPLAKPSDD